MKNRTLAIISLISCIFIVLSAFSSCGATNTSTGSNGGNSETKSGNQASGKNATYTISNVTGMETGAGTVYKWVANFTISASDGTTFSDASKLSATATLTNEKGTVVYNGTPKITLSNGIAKVTVDYNDVTAGPTCIGKGKVTLTLGTESKTYEADLDLLPYDMSDISLPTLPVSSNKVAGDGTVTATMNITEITKTLRYRGETVGVKITVKAKRTSTTGANDYIGAYAVVTVDGQEIKRAPILDKVDANGEISKDFSFEYKMGSAPVITFEDYK